MILQNRYTRRFGLTMLGDGDALALEGYAFTGKNRALLDQILRLAIENHAHTDTSASAASIQPVFGVATSGGVVPAQKTMYYRVALVDAVGQESFPSVATPIATPGPIPVPAAVGAVAVVGGGTLGPGDYLYQASAYGPTTGYETLASPAVQRSLGGTGTITLTMPPSPGAAAGWNIYRKGPFDLEPQFLVAILASETTYVDDGSVASDPLRSTPRANSTNAANAILVDLADGLPVGSTCKIYRTVDPSNWDRSLVVWTGTLPYTDTGVTTQPGSPVVRSTALMGAGKVVLTDCAEVQGDALPLGLVEGHELATWMIPGPVQVMGSLWWWCNEFDKAAVRSIRATLGVGSVPAATPVIVELGVTRADEWWPAGESFNNLIATATIPSGANTSGAVDPTATGADVELGPGDGLGVKITQAGGGATPTDYDLSVVADLVTLTGSSSTYVWQS